MRIVFGLTAVALTLTAAAPQSAEAAKVQNYYGQTSAQVARAIGCKHLHDHGAGDLNKDSAVCYLRGTRVNVLTYTGPRQQGEWNGYAKAAFPGTFFWADGRGAVIVARNGNRPAAQLGARILPGAVTHG